MLSREVSTGTTSSFPWDATWWLQPAVTRRRFGAELFDSTPTDHARVVERQTRDTEYVVPFGCEGSTPSPSTMPRWRNGRRGRLRPGCSLDVKVRILFWAHLASWWNGRHAGFKFRCLTASRFESERGY